MDVSELKQIVDIFVHEANETLTQFDLHIATLEKDGPSELTFDKLQKTTRTLKGSAAALGFADIADFSQHLETFIQQIRNREIQINPDIFPLLKANRNFLHEHIKALRTGGRSPGPGEHLIHAMEKEKEKKSKPTEQLIQLPRPAVAGDIWFITDDLKAELFELPEPPHVSTQAEPLPDPKLAAIQAEIARLTKLAATANLTTVEAASRLDEQSAGAQEWSLEGVQKIIEKTEQNLQPTSEQDHDATETKNQDNNQLQKTSAETSAQTRPPESESSLKEIESKSESNIENEITIKPESPPHPQDDKEIAAIQKAKEQAPEANLKIALSRIDQLIELTGELVMIQTILEENKEHIQSDLIKKNISQLTKMVRELKTQSTSFRLVSAQSIFSKTKKIISHFSKVHSKKTVTKFTGEENRIDKMVISNLTMPITELIKNAIRHGIETEQERITAGETAEGQITLQIKTSSRQITLEVTDDGRGLDTARIRERAITLGLMGMRENLSDDKIHSFIFHPEYSENYVPGHPDNRLQGLSSVAKHIKKINAKVEVETVPGKGTTVRINIPISSQIEEALVIKIGNERFIIEKSQISETLSSNDAEIDFIQGSTQLLNLRGTTVPLIHLNKLLKKQSIAHDSTERFKGTALVVAENTKTPFAVIVDDVISEQLVVIKNLGYEIQHINGLKGAAILGDGKPAIILNVIDLMSEHTKDQLNLQREKAA